MRKPSKLRLLPIILLAVAVACEGGGTGCSGCDGGAVTPYPDPPPPGGELQPDVVKARITQHALDFLSTHLDVLLTDFFDSTADGKGFIAIDTLIPTTGSFVARPGSTVAFDLANLNSSLGLEWADGPMPGDAPRMRISVNQIEIFLETVIGIDVPMLLPPAACYIRDEVGQPAVTIDKIEFDIEVGVDTTGPQPLLDMAIVPGSTNISLLGATDDNFLALETDPCDGSLMSGTCSTPDPLCTMMNSDCTAVCNLIDLFTQLGGFLATLIDPVLQVIGDDLAVFISDALVGALSGLPLGFETELDVGGLVGPIFGSAQPLSIKIEGSDTLSIAGQDAGRGLDLGLTAGAATTPAVCALNAPPPDLTVLGGPAPDFTGFVEVPDPGGATTHIERYHLAFTLSQALVAQATWGMYQSGLLCFSLDAYDVEELVGNAFSFTAGLLLNFDARLSGLTEVDAPMLASIYATQPPSVRLGEGGPVGMGFEDDPLIELGINDMLVGIYMEIDDQMLQVTELSADLVVSLMIERAPDNSLEISVTQLAVEDLRQVYNELAPEADLSGLFDLVVELAVDSFLGDSLKFNVDVSSSLGDALMVPLTLRLNRIRRDFGPTDVPYLSIYASLCDDNDLMDMNNPACFTPPPMGGMSPRTLAARIADEESLYDTPNPASHDVERWLGVPSGEAELQLQIGPLPLSQYEHQVRVDGGAWSGYRRAEGDRLWVQSARLGVVGRHTIEVRSRRIDSYTERTEATAVDFWIDRELPQVRATRMGAVVFVDAEDLGSGRDLEIFSRMAGEGDWIRSDTLIEVNDRVGVLEVMARDLAGNHSVVAEVALRADPLPANVVTASVEAPPSAGCAAAAPMSWLMVLMLGLAVSIRRRG